MLVIIVTYYISLGQLGNLCSNVCLFVIFKMMFCKGVHSMTRCYNLDKQCDKHFKKQNHLQSLPTQRGKLNMSGLQDYDNAVCGPP